MFPIVIIVFKSTTSIVWWINVNTFDLPGKVLLKSAECEKIVTVDEHIARPRFPVGERAGFDRSKTIFRSINE